MDRTFRGYENQEVYMDWNQGDDFKISIVRFENSGYSDVVVLEKELTKKYGFYEKTSQKEDFKKCKKSFWGRLFG